MKLASDKRIFARIDLADFVGRTEELGRLFRHARGETGHAALAVLAEPGAGVSEMLRQIYDVLFADQNEIVPFYFEIKTTDLTAVGAARRFLREFLQQTIAFRRGDGRIVDASPEVGELAELAMPEDGGWIDRLVDADGRGPRTGDVLSFIRNSLGAPLRAAGHGVRTFVMIDSLHTASELEDGNSLIETLRDIFASADIPCVFAGHRRYLYARVPFEAMPLERLSFEAAGHLVERLSQVTEIATNDQTRDLIAVQLGGNPAYISDLFSSAKAAAIDLDSFRHVEQAYTDEIFGGRISKKLDSIFDGAVPGTEAQIQIVEILAAAFKRLDGGVESTDQLPMFGALNNHEIVNLTRGSIRVDTANLVLGDYLAARVALEAEAATRAMVVGQAMLENVRRAPQLMARFYRRGAALGLPELMRSFDGRLISPAFLDYAKFKEEFKGSGRDDQILATLRDDTREISLPRIVYAAHTGGFYPPLNEMCDTERSAVAIGFTDASEKNDAVWIAAEIDSKLEASRELTEFWCDRLEMVALSCSFSNFKLWLVASEGFSPEALATLNERNALGSSRRQVTLLAQLLESATALTRKTASDEYELAVPMGEDTEMIAAGAVEEIAKRHNFPAKAVNQIKTALIEACINAAEHSLSPDRRIYQKFAFDAGALTITVANRGLRLADKYVEKETSDEGRRGWGLKLMKGLMDDVKIEQTDDGTRITMIKKLQELVKPRPDQSA